MRLWGGDIRKQAISDIGRQAAGITGITGITSGNGLKGRRPTDPLPVVSTTETNLSKRSIFPWWR